MSTPENTSPTPEALETRYTISLLWQNGSGRCEYQRPLPAHVADMLAQGQCPLHVAIWKHSEPPLDIGIGSLAPWPVCLALYSRQKQSQETDG
jgi:hypothetical protein